MKSNRRVSRRQIGAAGIAAAIVLIQQAQAAPISIPAGAFSYSQDFNTLAVQSGTGNGTTQAWANSTTIPGWVAFQAFPGGTNVTGAPDTNTAGYNAVTTITPGSGSSGTGALYSFGTQLTTDRALGSASSGTPGDFFYGVEFTNNSGGIIDSITVNYTGEQWRQASNPSTSTVPVGTLSSMPVSYSTSAASLGDIPGYTAVPALNFVGPQGTTSAPVGNAGGIDGNAAANSAAIGPVTISSLGLANGATLRLRWFDDNEPGNDHGLAIDNFTFVVNVPEPASLALGGMLLLGGLVRRRR